MKNKYPLFLLCLLSALVFLTACYPNTDGEYEDEYYEDLHEIPESTMNPNLPKETFNFEMGTEEYSIQLPRDRDLNKTFTEASHLFSYTGSLPDDWKTDYYAMFVSAEEDIPMVREIERSLRSLKPDASPDELAELTVAFVQGAIQYDWETYHQLDESSIRYPYETLYDGIGVCADKTILLAKLLQAQGYELAIFSFDKANHMALGLKVPQGYGMYNTDYTFVESTGYAPIGRIPGNYVGGVDLDANPEVVKLQGGQGRIFMKIKENRRREKEDEREYGRDYLFMNAEQKQLRREMKKLEAELSELKDQLAGCSGTLPTDEFERCNEVEKEHNTKVNEYNNLVTKFNRISNERNRPAA